MDDPSDYNPSDSTRQIPGESAGFTIGPYRIVKLLGKGGMGQVFLATDNLNRKVALKILSLELSNDELMRGRFINEARCQAKINHPNIATIFYAGEDSNRQFIAMEFIEGRTLRDLLKDGPMEFDRIRELFRQVCSGLQAAHEAGVIHRDMKPANVMVDQAGRVKILDFGLAKTETSTKHTLPGGRVGTVAYMSPEQAQGRKLDACSDIFSLGVILFEMATGRRPFRGTNDISLLFALSHDPHPDPCSLRTCIPENYVYVINTCLRKNPRNRFASVTELLEYFEGQREIEILVDTAELDQRISIAVLPFENRGSEAFNYFAYGIADEICAQLSKQKRLQVISYNSSRHYVGSEKSTRQIGLELGASQLLFGSLQLAGTDRTSLVRVNARLVNCSDDTVVWANNFDRLADQIFAVQSEVASSVAESLGIVLGEEDSLSPSDGSTASLDAYDHFLKANELFPRSLAEEDIIGAIGLYEQAASSDPGFALAHARLARAHLSMYCFHYDHSPQRMAMAQSAINRALAVAPDLPEAQQAIGFYHYYGKNDYDTALSTFAGVERQRPNDAGVIASQGFIMRRLGRWNEALESIGKASELDPRSALFTYERANTLLLMRRYDEAIKYLDRCLWLAPDWADVYVKKAMCFLLRDWSMSEAVQVFRDAAKHFNPTELAVEWILLDAVVQYYEGDLAKATENLWVDEGEMEVHFIVKARLCKRMGQEALAREYYDAAKVVVESKLKEDAEDARYWIHHGIANAGLGNKEVAAASGRKATELVPFEKDKVSSVYFMELLSLIYTMTDRNQEAVDLLRSLLLVPSNFSVTFLRNFSEFDPLRRLPGFKRLVE